MSLTENYATFRRKSNGEKMGSSVCDYNGKIAMSKAQRCLRAINCKLNLTPQFAIGVLKGINNLHTCNSYLAETTLKYPWSDSLMNLLIRYVELEHEVLYCPNNYSDYYKDLVENRVFRLLQKICRCVVTYNSDGTNIEKNTFKACYELLFSVNSKYKKKKLIQTMLEKAISKMNLVVSKFTDKHIPHPLDELCHPELTKIYEDLTYNRILISLDDYSPRNFELSSIDTIYPNSDNSDGADNGHIAYNRSYELFNKKPRKTKPELCSEIIVLDDDDEEDIKPTFGSHNTFKLENDEVNTLPLPPSRQILDSVICLDSDEETDNVIQTGQNNLTESDVKTECESTQVAHEPRTLHLRNVEDISDDEFTPVNSSASISSLQPIILYSQVRSSIEEKSAILEPASANDNLETNDDLLATEGTSLKIDSTIHDNSGTKSAVTEKDYADPIRNVPTILDDKHIDPIKENQKKSDPVAGMMNDFVDTFNESIRRSTKAFSSKTNCEETSTKDNDKLISESIATKPETNIDNIDFGAEIGAFEIEPLKELIDKFDSKFEEQEKANVQTDLEEKVLSTSNAEVLPSSIGDVSMEDVTTPSQLSKCQNSKPDKQCEETHDSSPAKATEGLASSDSTKDGADKKVRKKTRFGPNEAEPGSDVNVSEDAISVEIIPNISSVEPCDSSVSKPAESLRNSERIKDIPEKKVRKKKLLGVNESGPSADMKVLEEAKDTAINLEPIQNLSSIESRDSNVTKPVENLLSTDRAKDMPEKKIRKKKLLEINETEGTKVLEEDATTKLEPSQNLSSIESCDVTTPVESLQSSKRSKDIPDKKARKKKPVELNESKPATDLKVLEDAKDAVISAEPIKTVSFIETGDSSSVAKPAKGLKSSKVTNIPDKKSRKKKRFETNETKSGTDINVFEDTKDAVTTIDPIKNISPMIETRNPSGATKSVQNLRSGNKTKDIPDKKVRKNKRLEMKQGEPGADKVVLEEVKDAAITTENLSSSVTSDSRVSKPFEGIQSRTRSKDLSDKKVGKGSRSEISESQPSADVKVLEDLNAALNSMEHIENISSIETRDSSGVKPIEDSQSNIRIKDATEKKLRKKKRSEDSVPATNKEVLEEVKVATLEPIENITNSESTKSVEEKSTISGSESVETSDTAATKQKSTKKIPDKPTISIKKLKKKKDKKGKKEKHPGKHQSRVEKDVLENVKPFAIGMEHVENISSNTSEFIEPHSESEINKTDEALIEQVQTFDSASSIETHIDKIDNQFSINKLQISDLPNNDNFGIVDNRIGGTDSMPCNLLITEDTIAEEILPDPLKYVEINENESSNNCCSKANENPVPISDPLLNPMSDKLVHVAQSMTEATSGVLLQSNSTDEKMMNQEICVATEPPKVPVPNKIQIIENKLIACKTNTKQAEQTGKDEIFEIMETAEAKRLVETPTKLNDEKSSFGQKAIKIIDDQIITKRISNPSSNKAVKPVPKKTVGNKKRNKTKGDTKPINKFVATEKKNSNKSRFKVKIASITSKLDEKLKEVAAAEDREKLALHHSISASVEVDNEKKSRSKIVNKKLNILHSANQKTDLSSTKEIELSTELTPIASTPSHSDIKRIEESLVVTNLESDIKGNIQTENISRNIEVLETIPRSADKIDVESSSNVAACKATIEKDNADLNIDFLYTSPIDVAKECTLSSTESTKFTQNDAILPTTDESDINKICLETEQNSFDKLNTCKTESTETLEEKLNKKRLCIQLTSIPSSCQFSENSTTSRKTRSQRSNKEKAERIEHIEREKSNPPSSKVLATPEESGHLDESEKVETPALNDPINSQTESKTRRKKSSKTIQFSKEQMSPKPTAEVVGKSLRKRKVSKTIVEDKSYLGAIMEDAESAAVESTTVETGNSVKSAKITKNKDTLSNKTLTEEIEPRRENNEVIELKPRVKSSSKSNEKKSNKQEKKEKKSSAPTEDALPEIKTDGKISNTKEDKTISISKKQADVASKKDQIDVNLPSIEKAVDVIEVKTNRRNKKRKMNQEIDEKLTCKSDSKVTKLLEVETVLEPTKLNETKLLVEEPEKTIRRRGRKRKNTEEQILNKNIAISKKTKEENTLTKEGKLETAATGRSEGSDDMDICSPNSDKTNMIIETQNAQTEAFVTPMSTEVENTVPFSIHEVTLESEILIENEIEVINEELKVDEPEVQTSFAMIEDVSITELEIAQNFDMDYPADLNASVTLIDTYNKVAIETVTDIRNDSETKEQQVEVCPSKVDSIEDIVNEVVVATEAHSNIEIIPHVPPSQTLINFYNEVMDGARNNKEREEIVQNDDTWYFNSTFDATVEVTTTPTPALTEHLCKVVEEAITTLSEPIQENESEAHFLNPLVKAAMIKLDSQSSEEQDTKGFTNYIHEEHLSSEESNDNRSNFHHFDEKKDDELSKKSKENIDLDILKESIEKIMEQANSSKSRSDAISRSSSEDKVSASDSQDNLLYLAPLVLIAGTDIKTESNHVGGVFFGPSEKNTLTDIINVSELSEFENTKQLANEFEFPSSDSMETDEFEYKTRIDSDNDLAVNSLLQLGSQGSYNSNPKLVPFPPNEDLFETPKRDHKEPQRTTKQPQSDVNNIEENQKISEETNFTPIFPNDIINSELNSFGHFSNSGSDTKVSPVKTAEQSKFIKQHVTSKIKLNNEIKDKRSQRATNRKLTMEESSSSSSSDNVTKEDDEPNLAKLLARTYSICPVTSTKRRTPRVVAERKPVKPSAAVPVKSPITPIGCLKDVDLFDPVNKSNKRDKRIVNEDPKPPQTCPKVQTIKYPIVKTCQLPRKDMPTLVESVPTTSASFIPPLKPSPTKDHSIVNILATKTKGQTEDNQDAIFDKLREGTRPSERVKKTNFKRNSGYSSSSSEEETCMISYYRHPDDHKNKRLAAVEKIDKPQQKRPQNGEKLPPQKLPPQELRNQRRGINARAEDVHFRYQGKPKADVAATSSTTMQYEEELRRQNLYQLKIQQEEMRRNRMNLDLQNKSKRCNVTTSNKRTDKPPTRGQKILMASSSTRTTANREYENHRQSASSSSGSSTGGRYATHGSNHQPHNQKRMTESEMKNLLLKKSNTQIVNDKLPKSNSASKDYLLALHSALQPFDLDMPNVY